MSDFHFPKRERRPRKGLTFPDDGRTDQSFAKSSDINNIMAQFERTGDLVSRATTAGSYGDFSGVSDYHTSLLQLRQASAAFEDLPAHIRKRMGNDPQTFLDFVEDPENHAEGVELGLFDPKPKETETVPPAPDPEPTDPPGPAPS